MLADIEKSTLTQILKEQSTLVFDMWLKNQEKYEN